MIGFSGSVSFSDNDVVALKETIESAEQLAVNCQREFSGIWFRSDEESNTELRLLILPEIRLTVSRVYFRHQRIGTMTKIFSFLRNFCVRNNIPNIVVQSVETKEMISWCQKNGFEPSPLASFLMDGFIFGDYIFTV